MHPSTKKKLEKFLKVSSEFKLGQLDTERSHFKTKNLSYLSKEDVYKAIETISDIDLQTIKILEEKIDSVEEMRREIGKTFKLNGKVFICVIRVGWDGGPLGPGPWGHASTAPTPCHPTTHK